jgi:hypothetical protein
MDMIDPPKRTSTGPGCLMLAAIIIGTVIGLRNHQPSVGLVIGIGVALLIAAVVWVWDRLR